MERAPSVEVAEEVRAPGECIVRALRALGASQTQLARSMRIPLQRLHLVVHGKRRITPDTAVRLSRCLGRSPEYWMDRQTRFDLACARSALRGEPLEALVRTAGRAP